MISPVFFMFFQTRVIIGDTKFASENRSSHRVGIRSHALVTSIFLRLLSFFRIASGIVPVKLNGRMVYLNKGSFESWCTRQGLTNSSQSPEEKIATVSSNPSSLIQSINSPISLTSTEFFPKPDHFFISPILQSVSAPIDKTNPVDLTLGSPDSLPKVNLVATEKLEEIAKKINIVALEHFSPMLEKFYCEDGQPAGQLNNQWRRARVLENPYGSSGISPQKLRKIAIDLEKEAINLKEQNKDLEAESKLAQAKKNQKQADELEAGLQTYLEELPKSHFPLEFDHAFFTFEDFVKPETFSKREVTDIFYHKSTQEGAFKIRQDGLGILPAGYGVYLSSNRSTALGYSDSEESLLTYRLKPGLKLAKFNDYHWLFINEHLKGMARDYVHDNSDIIQRKFTQLDLTEDGFSLKIQLIENLTNRFAVEFFKRLGYAGVAGNVSIVGDNIVCVYDPNDLELIIDNK